MRRELCTNTLLLMEASGRCLKNALHAGVITCYLRVFDLPVLSLVITFSAIHYSLISLCKNKQILLEIIEVKGSFVNHA
jgi:hypothetical protein